MENNLTLILSEIKKNLATQDEFKEGDNDEDFDPL